MQYGIVRPIDLSDDEDIFIVISEKLEDEILKNKKANFINMIWQIAVQNTKIPCIIHLGKIKCG